MAILLEKSLNRNRVADDRRLAGRPVQRHANQWLIVRTRFLLLKNDVDNPLYSNHVGLLPAGATSLVRFA